MTQPWIYSARADGAFILAPALLVTLLVLALQPAADVPPWAWVLLIVGVDVSHVYSTLWRTYFDRSEVMARQALYILVPLLGWLAFTALYAIDAMLFWRVLAYVAVFHFVRQQYGFMMIYGRREQNSRWHRHIDQAAIYMATLYPLIYWHTHPREFQWFIEGDFFSVSASWVHALGLVAYVAAGGAYLVKEWRLWIARRSFNWPRNLLLLGTALSWGVGIVAFNNDLAFTATNVIAHGIPYMALVWMYGRNQSRLEPEKTYFGRIALSRVFSLACLPVFVGVLILFAYVEEGLWDSFIWTEHRAVFAPFSLLPPIEARDTLTWLVPLLALPQITHYILDAFIWRMRTEGTPWKEIMFYQSKREAA